MISVIIPVYNGSKTLPACLRALKNQTILPEAFEIIVVDDGSTDGTALVAQQPGVRVLRQSNAGAAAARNYGARVAQGELLLFTDADCVPAPDWVARMSAPFADATVAGAKGVYRTAQVGLTSRFVQMEYESKYDRMAGAETIDFVDTYSAAYRREVFWAVGGFDVAFPGASVEDQEFSFRVAEAGYRLVFAPQAMVLHTHDRSPLEYARRKYFIGYWKNWVVQRHPDKLKRDSHTPQMLKAQMGLAGLGFVFAALAILSRQAGWLKAGVLAWAGAALTDFPLYKKIWRRDRPVLWIAPWLLWVRAVTLGAGFGWGFIKLRLLSGRRRNEAG